MKSLIFRAHWHATAATLHKLELLVGKVSLSPFWFFISPPKYPFHLFEIYLTSDSVVVQNGTHLRVWDAAMAFCRNDIKGIWRSLRAPPNPATVLKRRRPNKVSHHLLREDETEIRKRLRSLGNLHGVGPDWKPEDGKSRNYVETNGGEEGSDTADDADDEYTSSDESSVRF